MDIVQFSNMLTLISDNSTESMVKRVNYKRIGLNEAENGIILEETPEDQFVLVNHALQAYVDRTEKLDSRIQPTPVNHIKGPFILAVSNFGDSIENSMLAFDLQKLQHEILPDNKVIASSSSVNILSTSLAVIPFVDVFKTQIEKEAKRSERLINSSKVIGIQDKKDREDTRSTRIITALFLEAMSSKEEDKTLKTLIGKEAISDSLAPSLSAKRAFYDALWAQMDEFFEPSVRYLGEQHALGKISLDSPLPIRP